MNKLVLSTIRLKLFTHSANGQHIGLYLESCYDDYKAPCGIARVLT